MKTSKMSLLRKIKSFLFLALGCFLLALYFEAKYYNNFYLVRIKQFVPASFGQDNERNDCLTGIIEMFKVVALTNSTEQNTDLNLKALDILVSTMQSYIESQRQQYEPAYLSNGMKQLEELRNEIRTKQTKGKVEDEVETGRDETTKETDDDDIKEDENDVALEEQEKEDYNATTNYYDVYEENSYEYQILEEKELEEGNDIDLKGILTIVLNFNNYTYKDLANVDKLLKDIPTLYPGVRTIVNSPYVLGASSNHENITIVSMDKTVHNVAEIWQTLLQQVNTKYVLILRDILSIDGDSRIRSLLYNLQNLDLDLIGGATKDFHNGHWTMGCSQMAYRNYVLVYKSGYRHSKNSCVFCHDIAGPFVAKSSLLKEFNFTQTSLPEDMIFHHFFLQQFKRKSKFAVCPDSMFLTRTLPATTERSHWLEFAVASDAHRITIPEGRTFSYTCKELGVEKNSIDDSTGVPFCAIQELMDHIKFIMRTCREHLIFCELSWGMQLNALKLNRVPPWEHDGDISFYHPQAEKLMSLRPLFEENGYSLYKHRYTGEWDSPWFRSNSKYWHVDLFNRTNLDSANLILQGKSPTKVLFDGEWVETSNNVGYSAKKRYGPEIFQHKEYRITYPDLQSFGSSEKHFLICQDEDAFNCLDQFPSDGNIDIVDPVP